jgi:Flp pilus assembly protein TadG
MFCPLCETQMMNSESKKKSCPVRRGVATIEFAVTLPVIFIIVIGSIEAASMLFLRQALVQSAYEGAKAATKSDASNATATEAVNSVLAGRDIDGTSITFNPPDVTTAAPGEQITVSVAAPGDTNSYFPFFGPFQNRMVEGRAVMVKE